MASVTLKLGAVETKYSETNNTSDIYWELSAVSNNAFNGYDNQCPFVIRYNNSSGSIVASGYKGFANNTTTLLASGTIKGYKHNEDGSGSITLYAHYTTGVSPASASTSTTINLTKIKRYATITSYTLTATSHETIDVTWQADGACDSVQYSLNGGSWVTPTGNSYPKFSIAGLKANTQYNIKIRVKKSDTQLWTESSQKSVTTLKANFLRIKNASVWKKATSYIKTNGVWKEVTPYIKVNGVWKEGV